MKIKRIKKLIRNKESYLVSGVPSISDIKLCEVLNVPLFGMVNENKLFSGASSAIQLFNQIDLPVPLSLSNICDFKEMIHEWGDLVARNIEINVWLFKIDHEFQGALFY